MKQFALYFSKYQQFLLLGAVLFIAVLSLVLNQGAEFSGADGQAEAVIAQLDPGYEPWFSNIWELPSAELESMLFALQAAIGSGVLFYIFGYLKGRKSIQEK